MTGRPVALVTGAARGIGAAVVSRLVARGHLVVALDSCAGATAGTTYPLAVPADLERVAKAHPGSVEPVVADVRDRAALAEVVAGIRRDHGRLDTVVAGAAVVAGGQAQWETGTEVLDLLWQTDVVGVWNTAAVALPLLVEQPPDRSPSFVAIVSAAGHQGLWHLTAYCTAKHAVAGLVRGLSRDVAGTGVTVCGVSPGSTRTPMLAATAALYGLEDGDELASAQSLGRLLEPDEVAAVVELACTGGPVVHGAVLPADGGFRG